MQLILNQKGVYGIGKIVWKFQHPHHLRFLMFWQACSWWWMKLFPIYLFAFTDLGDCIDSLCDGWNSFFASIYDDFLSDWLCYVWSPVNGGNRRHRRLWRDTMIFLWVIISQIVSNAESRSISSVKYCNFRKSTANSRI